MALFYPQIIWSCLQSLYNNNNSNNNFVNSYTHIFFMYFPTQEIAESRGSAYYYPLCFHFLILITGALRRKSDRKGFGIFPKS